MKTKRILLYTAIIYMIVIIAFPLFTLAESKPEGELSGDKLTLERIEGQDHYLVIAENNAVLTYKELTIKGDYARFNTESGQLLFKTGVDMTWTDFHLQGEELTGDINQEEFAVKGSPTFSYKEIQASADKITYNNQEQKAYLNGNVEGSQQGRTFSAQKVVIDLVEEKVEMSGEARFSFSDGGEE